MKKKRMVASLILALLFLGATSVSLAETVRPYVGRHGSQHAIHTEYDHFCHNLKTNTQPPMKEQTNPAVPAVKQEAVNQEVVSQEAVKQEVVNQEATSQQVEANHNPIIPDTTTVTPHMNSEVDSWHTQNQQNTQGHGNGQHGNRGQSGTNHQGGRGHRNGH